QDPNLNGDRNTVSNAPAAELALQLYFVTHRPDYLRNARQLYGWVRGCLMNRDGLYADHIDGDGFIDRTEWTYNQGTMIGAGVMLYQATHNRAYLAQAKATARRALRIFGLVQLVQQPAFFNAIYIRNLRLLAGVTGYLRFSGFAERY